MLLLVALLMTGGWFAAPSLAAQSEQLGHNLQESLNDLQTTLEGQSWAQPMLNLLPDPEQLSNSSGAIFSQISSIFSRTFNMFTNLVVILFVGFYLAFEPDLYANGLIKLVPKGQRRRAGELFDDDIELLKENPEPYLAASQSQKEGRLIDRTSACAEGVNRKPANLTRAAMIRYLMSTGATP